MEERGVKWFLKPPYGIANELIHREKFNCKFLKGLNVLRSFCQTENYSCKINSL